LFSSSTTFTFGCEAQPISATVTMTANAANACLVIFIFFSFVFLTEAMPLHLSLLSPYRSGTPDDSSVTPMR
jgi:hypothetical protein